MNDPERVRDRPAYGALLGLVAAFGAALLGAALFFPGAATDDAPAVRAFYESRAADFADPSRSVDLDGPLRLLRGPDDVASVPASVREAFGFYTLAVREQDVGSVHAFRADAYGIPTYGVLARGDGGDCWLEIFAADGALLGAARHDAGVFLWRDPQTIRARIFEGDLEPELLDARVRALERSRVRLDEDAPR